MVEYSLIPKEKVKRNEEVGWGVHMKAVKYKYPETGCGLGKLQALQWEVILN